MELLAPSIVDIVTKSAADIARGNQTEGPDIEGIVAKAVASVREAKGGEALSAQEMQQVANSVSAEVFNPQPDTSALQAGLEIEQIKGLVEMTQTDPNILPQPYVQPTQFTDQYPQPLDPTEILDMCEEITVWKTLPEVVTDYNADQWREMTSVSFDSTGETNHGFFTKGACPDEQIHEGENTSITRKYMGVYESITYEDLRHSIAVARARGLGISRLSLDSGIETVIGVKEKAIKLNEVIVMNKWDLALVKGSIAQVANAFDGIEVQVTAANGARVNSNPTGSFDIEEFDNFLAAGCARPTHIFGHPKALRGIALSYLSLGATGGTQPVQMIQINQDRGGIVAGFTLAPTIQTFVGQLTLVPDFRFTAVTTGADIFSSTVYPLRVYHNGEPIVYKSTQTPLSYVDLPRGCTAFAFEVYVVTSLVIKHMCAQAKTYLHSLVAHQLGIIGSKRLKFRGSPEVGYPELNSRNG